MSDIDGIKDFFRNMDDTELAEACETVIDKFMEDGSGVGSEIGDFIDSAEEEYAALMRIAMGAIPHTLERVAPARMDPESVCMGALTLISALKQYIDQNELEQAVNG